VHGRYHDAAAALADHVADLQVLVGHLPRAGPADRPIDRLIIDVCHRHGCVSLAERMRGVAS
jgi:hypothetical protein